MRIYLDVCCLNRPFDDQIQERVRLESEAVLLIMKRMHDGEWHWLGSNVHIGELMEIRNIQRRERVLTLASYVYESLVLMQADELRADALEALGFGFMDALHLACAERAKADVFLTTDDKLLKRAKRFSSSIMVKVQNPLLYWQEAL